MNHPVIIDVETQFSFREVNHDLEKLKVSLVGTYDFKTDKYRAYREKDLAEFFTLLEHASEIIGFNIEKFDLPVLAPYYVGKFTQFKTIDLLSLVDASLGRKVALNDLAAATLNVKKSGHGLHAIDLFREGNWEELEKYCLDDVKITKDLYDYAKKNNKLLFQDVRGVRDIKITFENIVKTDSAVSLSLPF